VLRLPIFPELYTSIPIKVKNCILLICLIFAVLSSSAQLNGNYTIGGTAPDYPTFADAANALHTQGVNGPVVFSVRDGIYQEALLLEYVAGVSPYNTITFEGESQDSTAVTLFQDATSLVDYTVRIVETGHVHFKHITIRNNGALNNDVIIIIGESDYRFESCIVTGTIGSSSSASDHVLYMVGVDSNLVINKSFILFVGNSAETITIAQASNPDRVKNIVVTDSRVGNFFFIGCEKITIKRSTIGGIRCIGASLEECSHNIMGGGFTMEGGGGDKFYNNVINISIANPTISASWYRIISGSTFNFAHNTIVFESANQFSFMFGTPGITASIENCTFFNNIFSMPLGGKWAEMSPLTDTLKASDYNCFDIAYRIMLTPVIDVADLQSVLNVDHHSFDTIPHFAGSTVDSLYPLNTLLHNGGTPIPHVQDDINGNPRNLLTPSIGAYEMTTAPYIALGPDTTYCDSVVLDARSINSTYLWSTGDTTRTITVSTDGTYWVTATNFLGTDSDTITLSFGTTPTIELPTFVQACEGDSMWLNPGSSVGSFLWGNGLITDSIQVTQNGLYSLTATNGSCSKTVAAYADFIPAPIIDLGPDLAFCYGDSAFLDAGALPNSFLWSTGEITNTIYADTTAEYIAIVSNQCATVSDTVQITAYVLPHVNIVGPTILCENESSQVIANGAQNYLWNGSIVADTIALPLGAAGDTLSFQLTGTDSLGCINTDSTIVVYVAQPNTAISGTAATCDNVPVVLQASATGTATYLWNDNSTGTSLAVAPTTTTTYFAIGTNANNCTDTAFQTVTVHPSPVLTISNDTTICIGDTIVLQASGGSAYLWNNGATTASTSVSPSIDTTYSVLSTTAQQCSDSADVTILVNALPPVPVITLNNGQFITNGGFSYQWYDDNGVITGANLAVYSPTQNGMYWVEITDANGCSNNSTVFDFITFSIGEIAEASQLHVSPNPTRGEVNVWFDEPLDKAYNFTLYNAQGQTIRTIAGSQSQSFRLSLTGLERGVYLLKFDFEGHGVVLRRVVLVD